jgi:hypothetical protein
LLKVAEDQGIDAVINGGDVMPMEGGLQKQGQFISRFLDGYFSRFNTRKIYYLSCPGNDDLKIFDTLYDETCDKYPFVKNLALRKMEIQGYEFIGMNWVADYPFQLKDRCRMDTDSFIFPSPIHFLHPSSIPTFINNSPYYTRLALCAVLTIPPSKLFMT